MKILKMPSAGGSGGVFYVDVTWDENSFNEGTGIYEEASANKTFNEIYDAYQQGLNVLARVLTMSNASEQYINFYPLQFIKYHTTSTSECQVGFDSVSMFPLGVQNVHISISGNGHVYVSTMTHMTGV